MCETRRKETAPRKWRLLNPLLPPSLRGIPRDRRKGSLMRPSHAIPSNEIPFPSAKLGISLIVAWTFKSQPLSLSLSCRATRNFHPQLVISRNEKSRGMGAGESAVK